MTTRQDVIKETREWIGTRYKHLGRVKGVSVDCVGLIIGVGRALGLSGFDTADYSQLPDPVVMKKHLDNELIRIELSEAQPGDILWIKWIQSPQHVAIISGRDDEGNQKMIHAYAEIRRCAEHAISELWRQRVVAAYKYKGVE